MGRDDHGHVAAWRREADRVLALLEDADLARPVPACPDWDVADLAFHLGWVFDRFRRIAGDRLTDVDQIRELERASRPDDDAALPDWLREQVEGLGAVLAGLDDDEPVWNFTQAPHVGAWVKRRMHHETAVHRHDLEEALGGRSAMDAVASVDGVDELLTVLGTGGQRWEGERPVGFAVFDQDSNRHWRLRLDPGERAVVDPGVEADVTVQGTGEALLLALWRRRPLDTVEVSGDPDLARAVLATIGR